MRKNVGGVLFLIKMILITKQTKNTFMTKPSKSLHQKLQHNIQSYTDIKTKIIRSQNMFLSLDNNSNGRPFLPTNSWRSLRQRLLRDPELALVSLAGTRCSNSDTSLQLSITQNYQSVLSAQIAVIKIKLLQQSAQNTSLLFFPLSSMNFLNIIHLNEFSLENI